MLSVAGHAGVTEIIAEAVGPAIGFFGWVRRRSGTLVDFGGAAHLIDESCFIFVISVLVLASHAGVTRILAEAVGPTVGLDSQVGRSRTRDNFDDFGGAAHLIGDGCCILVIGMLILASHACVTAISAATVGPAVSATRRSSTFLHLDILFGNWGLVDLLSLGFHRPSVSCVSLFNSHVSHSLLIQSG